MLLAATVIFSLQPYGGLTDGKLDWNIASDLDTSVTPNVVSELEFSAEAYHLGLKAKLESDVYWGDSQLLLEVDSNYGAVIGGESIDSDYFGDNRTGLYSRSEAELEGDSLNFLEGGIGFQTKIFSVMTFSIAYGGYRSEQNLNFQKGSQVYADPLVFFPFTLEDLTDNLQQNLDSDYMTEWTGQWLSIKTVLTMGSWEFFIQSKMTDGNYYGEGRWNLRATGVDAFQQPKSFTHEAKSDGEEWSIGLSYQLTKSLSFSVNYVESEQTTDAGLSVTYFSNGTFNRSVFNGASWESSRKTIGIEYKF
ncbi:MAG: hypothetical protein ACRBCS_06420 [Cellvibrionaceae bacterium]